MNKNISNIHRNENYFQTFLTIFSRINKQKLFKKSSAYNLNIRLNAQVG